MSKAIPVSMSAVQTRVARKLEEQGRTLRKVRGGGWFVIDPKRGAVVKQFDDLAAYADALGLLKAWERIAS